MPSDSPLIIENLNFRYRSRTELALKDINLRLDGGQVLLYKATHRYHSDKGFESHRRSYIRKDCNQCPLKRQRTMYDSNC